jgi:hypothetical protein
MEPYYKFVNNGVTIATATDPVWLEPLFAQYPNGQIIYVDPAQQPATTGAQTL